MSETKTRYVVENNGVFRETTTRQPVAVSPQVMAQYAGDKLSYVRYIMDAKAISPLLVGNLNVAVKGSLLGASVRLETLPLRARFKVSGDILVPAFTSESTPMYMEWHVPAMFYCVLLIMFTEDSLSPQNQYITFTAGDGRFFCPPTSNTYEDCRLCTGRYESHGSSIADMVARAVQQLKDGAWQSDLATEKVLLRSERMFRFKPLEPDGFAQLELQADNWQDLCFKVGNQTLENFIVV